MRGVVLSIFPQGYGFVRELADPNDVHSGTGDGYFYHVSDSPNLPDELYQSFIGSVVDFELIAASDWRQRAVNLTPVDTLQPRPRPGRVNGSDCRKPRQRSS